jgi:hypothetical protein
VLRVFWKLAWAGVFLLPVSAHAMTGVVLDFRGQTPVDIEVMDGWRAESTPNGLHILAPIDGRLLIKNPVTHGIDAAFLQIATPVTRQASFLWHQRSADLGTYVSLPLTLKPNASQIAYLGLDLTSYKQWDPQADVLGLALPANSEIYIQGIELLKFSWPEKMAEMWKSYWKFDELRGYSINFLWGPMFTTTPIGTVNLFTELPPRATSAVSISYIILLIGIVIAWGINRKWSHWSRFALTRRFAPGTVFLLLLFSGLWLMLDLRMGTELLYYAYHDYRTVLSGPPAERTFRSFGDIHAVLDDVLPHLTSEKTFGLVAPPDSAIQPILRYRAYPVLFTEDVQAPVQHWLIIARPDVTVDDQGLLHIGAVTIGPGKILKRYSDQSFLFSLQP